MKMNMFLLLSVLTIGQAKAELISAQDVEFHCLKMVTSETKILYFARSEALLKAQSLYFSDVTNKEFKAEYYRLKAEPRSSERVVGITEISQLIKDGMHAKTAPSYSPELSFPAGDRFEAPRDFFGADVLEENVDWTVTAKQELSTSFGLGFHDNDRDHSAYTAVVTIGPLPLKISAEGEYQVEIKNVSDCNLHIDENDGSDFIYAYSLRLQ